MITYFYALLLVLSIVFSGWWYVYAPCDQIKSTALTVGQVPMRCADGIL